jgi:coenzyme F420-reducing hydrogenase beta subunit
MTVTGQREYAPDDIVHAGLCIGCGSCVGQSPPTDDAVDGAHMALDRFGQMKPTADRVWLRTRTAEFTQTCPFSPGAVDEDTIATELFGDLLHRHSSTGVFRSAYVGHVAEQSFRDDGSSGGMVSWMLAELFRAGLIDGAAHVIPSDPDEDGRFFRYRISRDLDAVREGAKSRYYPIELSSVIDEIRRTPGRYAIVGVPCFVKAVHLLRRNDPVLRERIVFTLGLFCGHMKSARMVESFAWQMGVDVADVRAVEFRRKDPSRPASTYTAQLTLRNGEVVMRDWWNMVDGDWGSGFFQNSACDVCDDVVGETADISFGDAWVEPYSSDGRGTNVIVVRSATVDSLVSAAIAEGRLAVESVDGEFVERTQAAGLRHRREGLAYRLVWRRHLRLTPTKRVAPSRAILPRRKLVYLMRKLISMSSHRVFWLARRLGRPQLFLQWGRAAVALYHGLAYSRGRVGAFVDRLKLRL